MYQIAPDIRGISNRYEQHHTVSPHQQQYLQLNEEEPHSIHGQNHPKVTQLAEVQEQEDQSFEPSMKLKVFFSYLYFTQGIVQSFPSTMPYVYPKLPSYDVMALFSAVSIPYLLKFLAAPFIEKYTIVSYGKRKFWIIIAQTLTAISVFGSSFFTDFSQAYTLAILLFCSNLCMVLQDIALDSLAKKQLKVSHLISMISGLFVGIGIIMGSMLLLKLTSQQFSDLLSLSHPITTTSVFLKFVSLVLLSPTLLVHFFFKETILDSEYESVKLSICKIISSYKVFFKVKGKYFRTILMYLIMNQGFIFFHAGYTYELIKAGFSRNTNNTIQNLVAIPVAIITCVTAHKIKNFGLARGTMACQIGLVVSCFLLRIFFPLNVPAIVGAKFIMGLMASFYFMIITMIIYEFPLHSLSGMYITFLASFCNFGFNSTIHTKIIARTSWWLMSAIGLGLQVIIILFLPKLLKWREQGSEDLEYLMQDEGSEQDVSEASSNQKHVDNRNIQNAALFDQRIHEHQIRKYH